MVEEKQHEGTNSVCSDYSFSTVASEVATDESLRSFTFLPNCGSSPTDSETSFYYSFSPNNIHNECKTCTQNCHECTIPCSQYSGGICTYDPSTCSEKVINDPRPCHGIQLVCSADLPCYSCTAYYTYENKNCIPVPPAPPLKYDFSGEVASPSRMVMDVDKDHSHGNSPKSPLSPEVTFAAPDYHAPKSAFVYPGCPTHLCTLKENDDGSKRCYEKSSMNHSSPPPTDNLVHSTEVESLPPCYSSSGFYGPDGCWYPSSPLVYQGHPYAYHFSPALYWGYSKLYTNPSVTENKTPCNSPDNQATLTTQEGIDDKNPNQCCIKENGVPQGTVQSSSINGYDTSKNNEKKSRLQGRTDTTMSSTKNMYPVYNLYQRLDLPHDFLGRPKLLCSIPVDGKLSVEEVWVYHMQLLFKNLPHTWTIHYSEAGTRFLGNWGMFKDHAKVRFYCKECNDGWTSMYGIVVFMYRQNFEYGEIQYQVVGQKCSHCHPTIFEMPLWYPEEAQKVITNLYYEISSKIYGLHTPRTIRTRRLGQPHTQHNHQLCQGCYSGVCRLSNKTLLLEA